VAALAIMGGLCGCFGGSPGDRPRPTGGAAGKAVLPSVPGGGRQSVDGRPLNVGGGGRANGVAPMMEVAGVNGTGVGDAACPAPPAVPPLPGCDMVRLLGEGTFGTVLLVRERSTGSLFAVKVMRKAQLIESGQLAAVTTERAVLRDAGPHPFVVRCESGFHTHDAVVLVLEYVSGGDFFDLMKAHGTLDESAAVFYLAELVLAVGELHRHSFVCRDLKLENILVDAAGHLRLTDFGLAGRVASTSATDTSVTDLSGTAIYQAPEMLTGKGHGLPVDWWAMGVLTYVMLAGRPPFASDGNRSDLHARIRTQQLDLDGDPRTADWAAPTKDLVRRLLDRDVTKRLGSGSGDAEDVKAHPFFEGVDWDAVLAMQVTPPLPPPLTAPSVEQVGLDAAGPAGAAAAEKLSKKLTASGRPASTSVALPPRGAPKRRGLPFGKKGRAAAAAATGAGGVAGGRGGHSSSSSGGGGGSDGDVLALYKAVAVDRTDEAVVGRPGTGGARGGFAPPSVSVVRGPTDGGGGGGDARRVSIGLDWGGKRPAASGRTWTGTTDDFGRSLSEAVNDHSPGGGHIVMGQAPAVRVANGGEVGATNGVAAAPNGVAAPSPSPPSTGV